jgi:hypothetical protein
MFLEDFYSNGASLFFIQALWLVFLNIQTDHLFDFDLKIVQLEVA